MTIRRGRREIDIFKDEFRVTPDHLTLLQRMYVGWSSIEYGAPEINPKRPYGNSAVEDDICEILGLGMVPDPEDEGSWVFPSSARTIAADLHVETMYALQIVLCTQSFQPGLYRRTEEYNLRSWVFVRE